VVVQLSAGTPLPELPVVPPVVTPLVFPAPEVPPPVSPPAPGVGALPEHAPLMVGWQKKPSPQSASALQGSCHLNAQVETVSVVHWDSVTTPAVPHFVFGSQEGTVPPPEQVVTVSPWQIIPVAQSLSAVHGPGTQDEMVEVMVVPGSLVPPSVAGTSPLEALPPAPAVGAVPEPPVGTAVAPPCGAAPPVDPPVPVPVVQGASGGQAGVVPYTMAVT